MHAAQLYPAIVKARVHGVIFKYHQVVEQVSAHCRQRHIAIAHLLQILLFHLCEKCSEGIAGCPTRPQRQGLDKQPHGCFNTRNLSRAARSDHAINHVAAALVDAAKHNGPQGLHQS